MHAFTYICIYMGRRNPYLWVVLQYVVHGHVVIINHIASDESVEWRVLPYIYLHVQYIHIHTYT